MINFNKLKELMEVRKRAAKRLRMSDEELLSYIGEYIRYDKDTGKLFWKARQYRAWGIVVGSECGNVSSEGYRNVSVYRRDYKTHRLIWLIETGKSPADQIDHKCGNRLNNHILNLREASVKENNMNQGLYKNNKYGIVGVSPVKGKVVR